jgi:hypothetical protein
MNVRRLLTATGAALAFASGPAAAHCDTLDGPVVSAARKALDAGKVELVLIWVRADDEAELRTAFDRARTVRKGGGEAKELADLYFFETLVRVHRAGEGAPYTGLKPAGTVEPAVAWKKGLHGHFNAVMAKKNYQPDDVAAGRAYSSAYVEFVHYAERLYEAAETLAPEHVQKAPGHAH